VKQRIAELLQRLQESMDEAIADSPDVAEVMTELENEGVCPSFSVIVNVPDGLEQVTRDGPLVLTPSDEEFLKDMGITTQYA